MRDGQDPFGVRDIIETAAGEAKIYRLGKLEERGFEGISLLPYSIRILLESMLRHADTKKHIIASEDVEALARWNPANISDRDIPFIPSRVIMQDFTGVPAVVDLAALRSAMQRLGDDPDKINPVIPVDLVIDHSIQKSCWNNNSFNMEVFLLASSYCSDVRPLNHQATFGKAASEGVPMTWSAATRSATVYSR